MYFCEDDLEQELFLLGFNTVKLRLLFLILDILVLLLIRFGLRFWNELFIAKDEDDEYIQEYVLLSKGYIKYFSAVDAGM